jgi:hypothetical protein
MACVLKSVARKRLMEAVIDWGHWPACQWYVKCSRESWVYKRSINRVTNPNSVYSHTYTRRYDKLPMFLSFCKYQTETQLEQTPGDREGLFCTWTYTVWNVLNYWNDIIKHVEVGMNVWNMIRADSWSGNLFVFVFGWYSIRIQARTSGALYLMISLCPSTRVAG